MRLIEPWTCLSLVNGPASFLSIPPSPIPLFILPTNIPPIPPPAAMTSPQVAKNKVAKSRSSSGQSVLWCQGEGGVGEVEADADDETEERAARKTVGRK